MVSPLYTSSSWKTASVDRWQSNWTSSTPNYIYLLYEDRCLRDWINFFFFLKQRECFKKLSGLKKKHKNITYRVLKRKRELVHTVNLRRLRRKCTNKALNWSVSRVFFLRTTFLLLIVVFISLWLIDRSWLNIRSKCSEWIKSQVQSNFTFFIIKKLDIKIIWLNSISLWWKGIFFKKKFKFFLKKKKYSVFKKNFFNMSKLKFFLKQTKHLQLNRHRNRFWQLIIKKNKLCYLLLKQNQNKISFLNTFFKKKNNWLKSFFFLKNSILNHSYLYAFYKDFYMKRVQLIHEFDFNNKQNIYLDLFKAENVPYYLKLKSFLNKAGFWTASSNFFSFLISVK